jgi:hypothetical protein
MNPREPLNKQEKRSYWKELSVQPWSQKISLEMPSLWPSREKVEGFDPACTECECRSSCNRIVFVVGCGHSGTTYMTKLLGSHLKYHAILQETGWFSELKGSAAAFERFRQASVECGRIGKMVLVEKTAKHVMFIKRILQLFPNSAKIVLMVRDGRDVTLSVAKRYRRDGVSFRPCTEATRWTMDNAMARQFFKKKGIIHQVRYEDLIADASGTMNRVFQHLEGENAPPEVLSQFESASTLEWGKVKPQTGDPPPADSGVVNKKYRNWQINQKLFDGRGQWADPKTGFTDEQLRDLYACPQFEEYMKLFGYFNVENKTSWYDRSLIQGSSNPPPMREFFV